ncbi:MAG: Ig-like domain-containing protein [Deltaproteobacteria bacterium]|nr:Ig-like domain-containing protein [Deltaproteobacteria bacterium]
MTSRKRVAIGLGLCGVAGLAAGIWWWTHRPARQATVAPPNQAELGVLMTAPTGDGVPIGVEGITAMFDRAMVPLTTLDAGRDQAIPLTIAPPIEGKFFWLGTRGFSFRPATPLSPATQYTVTLPAEVAALDGARLGAPVTWTFATVRPRLRAFEPGNGNMLLPKAGFVLLRFNLAMDRADVEQKLRITEGKEDRPLAIARTLHWLDDDHAVLVRFSGTLPWDTSITVTLAADARAKRGSLGTTEAATATYTTPAKSATIKRVVARPEGGKTIDLSPGAEPVVVPPMSGICYHFSQPVDAVSFEKAFHADAASPYFFYEHGDWWTVFDAKGTAAERTGYAAACIAFLDAFDRTYTFWVDPKKVATLSGAPLRGKPGKYRVKTGHAPTALKSNLTKNVLSFRGPLTLPYRVMNLKGLTVRLYPVPGVEQYREYVRDATLSPKGKYDAKQKRFIPDEPPMSEDITQRWSVPMDLTTKAIDPSRLTAAMELIVASPFGVDESGVLMADLAGLREEGRLRPGRYLVEAIPEALPSMKAPAARYSIIQVSPVALAMKHEVDHVLVWATDIESGEPVGDLLITVTWQKPSQSTAEEAEGTTNAQGVAILPLQSQYPYFFCAEATAAESAALTCEDDHRLSESRHVLRGGATHFGYVYTDRPIYRPGQTVQFSAFIRRVQEGRYFLPTAETADVTARDASGTTIFSQDDVSLANGGVVTGRFPLPDGDDAPRGEYAVQVKVGEQTFRRAIFIASYRKPSFKVDLAAARDAIVSGEDLETTVQAQYFFGAPLRKAKAKWSIMTTTYRFRPEGYEDFTFIDEDLVRKKAATDDEEGEEESDAYDSEYEYDIVASSDHSSEDADQAEDPRGRGATRRDAAFFQDPGGRTAGDRGSQLDVSGRLTIRYRPDLTRYPTSQVLAVEASVSDPANQEVAAAADVIVHKADFYLGLKPAAWVVGAGAPARIDVVTLTTDGKPAPRKSYSAAIVRREYQFIQRRNAHGFWEYTFEPKDTPVSEQAGATDDGGRAAFTFTPKEPGTYRVVMIGRDAKSRQIQAAEEVAVWGAGFVPWRLDQPERITLVPDKSTYAVGETARILVKSLLPVTKALVTLERGRLLEYRIVELGGGNAGHLEVPITEGTMPNVFVSVVAHAGRKDSHPPMLFAGETELVVDPGRKRLHVTLALDRKAEDGPPVYRPGETVRVTLATKDPAGAPRKAHVAVSVADESVLRLLDYRLPDLVKRFYFWRRNSVVSASAMRSLKAGDGGVAEGKKRRIFKDTAHFEAHVVTDEHGEGTFAFTLPDDLTTWVVEAVAVSEPKSFAAFETERAALVSAAPDGVKALDAELTIPDGNFVGGARAVLMTTLPVLVRPALPRFLVWGDTVRGAVVANNRNPHPVTGTVRIALTGDAVFSGSKVEPADLAPRTSHLEHHEGAATHEIPFHLAGGAEQTFPFALQIARTTGQLTVEMATVGERGTIFDSMEVTLPVLDRYAPEVVASSGLTQDAAREQIAIPSEIAPDRGGLDLSLRASLALAAAPAMRGLITYPYGCSEQRSAALLALLMARETSARYGETYFDALVPVSSLRIPAKASWKDKLAVLDRLIDRHIAELTGRFQAPDGGIRYWPDDEEASRFASVQSFWALTMARRLKVAVPDPAYNALFTYLGDVLRSDLKRREWRLEVPARIRIMRVIGYVLTQLRHEAEHTPDEWAYLLWGRALGQGWDDRVAERLLAHPERLSASGAAYLLLALVEHKALPAAGPVRDRLLALATQNPRSVSWPASPFFWSTALKNTGLAARALLHLDAKHPLIPRAMPFLLNRKKTREYTMTQEDLAVAVFAYDLGGIMKESATDYTATVRLGGQVVAEQPFARANLLTERRETIPMASFKDLAMPADLELAKAGAGTLYYDMLLKYYLPPEQTPTREEGLVIAREYYALDDVQERRPLTQFTVGENYKGHITLVVPKALSYVVIEDLLPSGFEPIDMTLAISSRAAQQLAERGPRQRHAADEEWWAGHYDDVIVEEDYGMDWSFAHQEVRDDAILWSDRAVPPGVYHLRYPVRATTAGGFLAPGATAFEFYEPEVFGRSRTRMIEVR